MRATSRVVLRLVELKTPPSTVAAVIGEGQETTSDVDWGPRAALSDHVVTASSSAIVDQRAATVESAPSVGSAEGSETHHVTS